MYPTGSFFDACEEISPSGGLDSGRRGCKQNLVDRRLVLKAVSAVAGAAAASFADRPRRAAAQPVKWSAESETPKPRAPADAADCHHHIYDSKYPPDPRSTLRPGDASVADYQALQHRIGTSRNVIVFDHLARIPEPDGAAHPLFGVVIALIDKGNTWVKLSGAYADTKVGPPSYSDSSAVARAYVQRAPERLVWGSDWPHPGERENKPDDAVLFDLLLDWAPDERVRNRILVQKPEALYGFSEECLA